MANELKIVTATPPGEEQGYIDYETDLEIGEENDFELRMSLDDWDTVSYTHLTLPTNSLV